MLLSILADLPVAPALTVLAGSGIVVYGAVWYERARVMQRWPSAPGIVSRAGVEEFLNSSARLDGPAQKHYRAAVAYDYEVGGREYRARRVALVEVSASWRAPAEAIVARYPKGSAVTVYYNPAHPPEAILERGSAPAWATALQGIGLLAMLGGIAWGIVAPRA